MMGMSPGHGVRIVNFVQPAVAEKIAEPGVIEEGRVKKRTGVTRVMHQLEESFYGHAFQCECIKILNGVQRREGGKPGVNRTGEAREKIREKLHSIFVFGKQRLGFF